MHKNQHLTKISSIILQKTKILFVLTIAFACSAQVFLAQNTGSRTQPVNRAKSRTKNIVNTQTAPMVVLPPTAGLSENFDNVAAMTANGWFFQNNSSPVGTSGWFQGDTSVFVSQSGASTSYIAANFNNTGSVGTISNWMLTPQISLRNGDQIKFWTRTVSSPQYPDRLEVRLSSNGASTNVGSTATSVGDFTSLLLVINQSLTTTGYPNGWTEYTIVINGLSAPTSGRIGFRYFVTNGGSGGTNSDYIGIDTFSYVGPTAASVSVSGRVVSPRGQGISRATVQMIDQNGEIRTAQTNSFGNYRFDGVPVGENYVVNVFAKGFYFESQIVNVLENVQELNFTAQE